MAKTYFYRNEAYMNGNANKVMGATFSWRLIAPTLLVAVFALPLQSRSQELPITVGKWISDPSCKEWVSLHAESKTKWVGVFLSTMSMGLARGKKEQKYRADQDYSAAVAAMDNHCVANPDGQASQGVAEFMNY